MVVMVVVDHSLESVISEVFSNLTGSVIRQTCCKEDGEVIRSSLNQLYCLIYEWLYRLYF